jgi:hypothetical protein
MKHKKRQVETIKQISQITMIAEKDILTAMKELGLVLWYKNDWQIIDDKVQQIKQIKQKKVDNSFNCAKES